MSFLVRFVDDVDDTSPKQFGSFHDAYLEAEAGVQAKAAPRALIYQLGPDGSSAGKLVRSISYKSSDEEISRAREQAWSEAQVKGMSLAQFLRLVPPSAKIARRV
jgi:hypothetical protein